MTSSAKRESKRIFLFGNHSLHMRWLGLASPTQRVGWERTLGPHTAQILLCEGPWTQFRAQMVREALAELLSPKLFIVSGPLSLPEQTIMEGLTDHVDILLPEGLPQFWRGDVQELVGRFLQDKKLKIREL